MAEGITKAAEQSFAEKLILLEQEQQQLEEESQRTIAANLEQLAALQRQLDGQRSRLAKQQRRMRGANQAPNYAEIEQQRMLESEINEIRRRRDIARDANQQTEKKLQKLAEEAQRLQHMLNTPAETPFGKPMRGGGQSRIGGSRPQPGVGGAGVEPPLEVIENQLDNAENRLASETLRRETYQHMTLRLKREQVEFDSHYLQLQAALTRERKRAQQLRVNATDAVQAVMNAQTLQRQTEKRVAMKVAIEKQQLSEQQATLLQTQASVRQFEVTAMSRNPSVGTFDSLSTAGREVLERSDMKPAGAGLDRELGSEGGGDAYGGEAHEEERLYMAWQRVQQATRMSEPTEIILKALEQVSSQRQIEDMESQATARLAELREEADRLASRRRCVDSAAERASRKRLERLHQAVNTAEAELNKSTEMLERSDARFADARHAVMQLTQLAAREAREACSRSVVNRTDPMTCEGEELPPLVEETTAVLLQEMHKRRSTDSQGRGDRRGGAPASTTTDGGNGVGDAPSGNPSPMRRDLA